MDLPSGWFASFLWCPSRWEQGRGTGAVPSARSDRLGVEPPPLCRQRRLPQVAASVTVAVSASHCQSSLASFWFWGFDFVMTPIGWFRIFKHVVASRSSQNGPVLERRLRGKRSGWGEGRSGWQQARRVRCAPCLGLALPPGAVASEGAAVGVVSRSQPGGARCSCMPSLPQPPTGPRRAGVTPSSPLPPFASPESAVPHSSHRWWQVPETRFTGLGERVPAEPAAHAQPRPRMEVAATLPQTERGWDSLIATVTKPRTARERKNAAFE